MASPQENSVSAIEWRDDALWLLDQRLLPLDEVWLQHLDVDSVVTSIREMVVRGAPAIGITAAYGVVIAARNRRNEDAYHWLYNSVTNDKKQHQQISSYLARLEKLMHPKAVREAKRPLDS